MPPFGLLFAMIVASMRDLEIPIAAFAASELDA